MLENRSLLGLAIGQPISAIGGLHAFLRRDYLVAAMRTADPNAASVGEQGAFLAVLAGFALTGPMLGLAGALIYGRLPSAEMVHRPAAGDAEQLGREGPAWAIARQAFERLQEGC